MCFVCFVCIRLFSPYWAPLNNSPSPKHSTYCTLFYFTLTSPPAPTLPPTNARSRPAAHLSSLPCDGPCLSNRLGLGLTERFSHLNLNSLELHLRHRTLNRRTLLPTSYSILYSFLPFQNRQTKQRPASGSTCSWYSTLFYSNTLPLLIRRASLFELFLFYIPYSTTAALPAPPTNSLSTHSLTQPYTTVLYSKEKGKKRTPRCHPRIISTSAPSDNLHRYNPLCPLVVVVPPSGTSDTSLLAQWQSRTRCDYQPSSS